MNSSNTSFNDLNTFRSIIEKMSSSSDNELPEIPGTRFPWMEEATSSSTSRGLGKQPKRHLSSGEDELVDPQPGPSRENVSKVISPAEIKKQKARERQQKYRAKLSEEKKQLGQ